MEIRTLPDDVWAYLQNLDMEAEEALSLVHLSCFHVNFAHLGRIDG